MNDPVRSFDPIWEDKYRQGHAQRYPWDAVVSFVFRNAPRDRPRERVHILEVGCGTASNLWFAAREGFSVAGVDAAASAISTARARFMAEGLAGELRVADFTTLPFADGTFDLVIDRAALTCAGLNDARRAIREIHRVTRGGGRFFFNPYSVHHTSRASGRRHPDGLTHGIEAGSLTSVGQICFYGRSDIEAALQGWQLRSLEHLVITDVLGPNRPVHAEWRAIAEKTS
jgi:SAM-dependent methyltransferase